LRPYKKVGSSKPTLDRSAVRLIGPDEAVEHIGLLLANEQIDLKQRLLFMASVAIAGMIGLEGDSIERGRIDGLQQGVNRMLFINDQR
jgi:hypothetical protein